MRCWVHGADVSRQKSRRQREGRESGSALQAAQASGYELIVQLLLDKRENVNAPGRQYGNSLQAASSHCHESMVQLLRDKRADVNASGNVRRRRIKLFFDFVHLQITKTILFGLFQKGEITRRVMKGGDDAVVG